MFKAMHQESKQEQLLIIFKEMAYFPVGVLLATVRGWWYILGRLWVEIRIKAHALTPWQLAFLVFNGAVAVLALTPWMVYSIDLLGPEQVYETSAMKLLFFLPGAMGIFLLSLDIPGRKKIYYGVAGFSLLLYSVGYIWPGIIHTRMKRPGDYSYLPWIYLYGPFLLGGIALVEKGMTAPLLRLFRYLLSQEQRSLLEHRREESPQSLRSPVPHKKKTGKRITSGSNG